MAVASMVIGAYLVYAVFDDWSYLRFLLPSMAVLAVFTALELSAWMGRWPASYRAPILLTLALLVTGQGIWVARSVRSSSPINCGASPPSATTSTRRSRRPP